MQFGATKDCAAAFGEADPSTFKAKLNHMDLLLRLRRLEDAERVGYELGQQSEVALGAEHALTLQIKLCYGMALCLQRKMRLAE